MAYRGNYFSGELIPVTVGSARGEELRLSVPRGTTVGEMRNFLIQEYDYPSKMHLMYESTIVPDDHRTEDYPDGSLIIMLPVDLGQGSDGMQPQAPWPSYRGLQWQEQPYASQWSQPNHRNQQTQQRRQQEQHPCIQTDQTPQIRHQQQQQQHARQHEQPSYGQAPQTAHMRYLHDHHHQQQQNYHQQHQQLPQQERFSYNQAPQPTHMRHQRQQQQQNRQQYSQKPQQPQQHNAVPSLPQSKPYQKQAFERPLSAKRQGQPRRKQDRLHSTEPQQAPTTTPTPPVELQRSRPSSNSRASSGTRTPRGCNTEERFNRQGDSVRSAPRPSSPPLRSPYRSGVGDSDINADSNGTPPVSVTLLQGTDGDGLKNCTPRVASASATPLQASMTPGEANDAEAANAPSSAAGGESPSSKQISLKCVVPALKKNIPLMLAEDATLDDLLVAVVAQDPRLAGSKVIFRGKLLKESHVKLSVAGIRPGAPPSSVISTNPNMAGVYTLFFASGEFSDPEKVMLLEIEADVACVETEVERGELTLQQRRGYYEELMRILFRTDDLQELEGEWRARRKEVVLKVTSMQDRLRVTEDV
ncbi:hypothetical protein DQ04_08641010 [Trypanosoma grayi]|uniref:hypothetical protein n=1 Tax=Trypanosoma grayi TaxID=71804 RepID=UPI0004F463C9|nr:hypothetical protein DQ04_08641010 [Trypanosoma grayi]KEG07853.1 hypothetical protein DQ04_08641010 [Trypanosoma grayi]